MSALSSRRRSLGLLVGLAVVAALALACVVALGTPSNARAADVTANVYLLDSSDNGIEGARILYGSPNGGWHTLGFTDADGLVTGTVPGNSYLGVAYNEGSVYTSGPVDFSQPYTFKTTKVTLLHPAPIIYAKNGNSGWRTFTSPMELLPGDFLVRSGGNEFSITVSDTNITGALLRLIDSNGDGLEGGTWSYYLGGWYSGAGTTDANGNLFVTIPNDSPYLTIAMGYAGSRQQMNRTQLTAANFTFQTAEVAVNLKDADGNPLDTGQVSYYAGGWKTFGTGTTSSGSVTQELLPTTKISVRVGYNFTSQQKDNISIVAPATAVDFQTGRLSINFSSNITWYTTPNYHTFSNGMEFMPGNRVFYLGGSTSCAVTIPIASGDKLVKSGIVATLRNGAFQPLSGGVASVFAGGWQSLGTTNGQGRVCAVVDGTLGNAAVNMTYAGTSQTITQNQPTSSYYNFTAALVTVELRDSTNALMDSGSASYYAGGWKSLGNTSGGTVVTPMLPGSYSFSMVFNGTQQQLNGQVISGNTSVVTFKTTSVTVKLIDSAGDPLDTGSASYYANGWRAIGDTAGGEASVEMLPGSYAFAMVFKGTSQQLNGQPISGPTSTVTFQTGTVTSTSGAATSYYAGGWRAFTNGMDLLPGTYTFAFNDSTPNTPATITAGADTTIH